MKKILFVLILALPIQLFADNILYFGDSHSVGHFGIKLDRLLRKNKNDQIYTIGSCGSIARWFFTGHKTRCGYFFKDNFGKTNRGNKAKTPIISKVLDKFTPDYIIVALGANYYKYSNSYTKKDLNRLLDLIKTTGSPCLWVGPPDTRKYPEESKKVYKNLEEVVASQCRLFHSEKVTKYPTSGGDGIHYWGKGKKVAQNWASLVLEEFNKFRQ